MSHLTQSQLHARRALSERERGACPMEGSTREGKGCGLFTSFVSCVVRGPWRRELLRSQAAQHDLGASEGTESRTRGAGER
eukprot:6188576-Pleurochrysis_carterae.AAC.2